MGELVQFNHDLLEPGGHRHVLLSGWKFSLRLDALVCCTQASNVDKMDSNSRLSNCITIHFKLETISLKYVWQLGVTTEVQYY